MFGNNRNLLIFISSAYDEKTKELETVEEFKSTIELLKFENSSLATEIELLKQTKMGTSGKSDADKAEPASKEDNTTSLEAQLNEAKVELTRLQEVLDSTKTKNNVCSYKVNLIPFQWYQPNVFP